MPNEYGVKLDRNGYAPSILNTVDGQCYICKCSAQTNRHEVFHGSLYRKRSKEYGLWVNVCPSCHRMIHNGRGFMDRTLKEITEDRAIRYYNWTIADFRERFGKNYI